LRQIGDQYRVLEVNKIRLNHYETLYFDTSDFQLYHQHHNGLGSRYKIRAREYVDSDVTFFEIKHKTNQDRTEKSRVQIPAMITDIAGSVEPFVSSNTPIDPEQLEPKLWNRFLRITLVSKHNAERLTLDVNLEFGWGDTCIALPGVAIAEVKQERFSTQSDFIQQMRHSGIRPMQFSKYCAGIYLLYDQVKVNNFKPRMREVAKLIGEEYGIAG
jgi:SPX domain protein involved in polyphosphate accumulation